jgi:dihydrofolate reductase
MTSMQTSPGRVIAGMTISLDGFVRDIGGSTSQLYTDLPDWRHSDRGRDSIDKTGAVLMGRRTFDMAADPDSFAVQYEYQVPIFVLTSHPPTRHPKENESLTFAFIADGLESAIDKAKRAAGSKWVTVVGGPTLIQALLKAGFIDELEVDVMPVLLGGGLRLFDALDVALTLDRVDVTALPYGRTALRYAVRY